MTPPWRLRQLCTSVALCAVLTFPAVMGYAHAAQGTYVVQANDTLSGIALRYGTSVQALMTANNLVDADHIVVGQVLSLGGAGDASAAFSSASTGAGQSVYVVQPGDTLSVLSQRFGVSIASLVSLNGLTDPSRIAVGQQLVVPAIGGGAAPDYAQATQLEPSGGVYVVQPGDTLSAISGRFGTTLDTLTSANNLSLASVLSIGQRLSIPSSASGLSSAASVGDSADQAMIGQVLTSQALAAGVDPALVKAVAWQESGWQMVTASDGGMGVMQLMPDTVSWVSTYLLDYQVNPYDVTDNIRAGVAMLRYFLLRYGDVTQALAAYHQGMGSLESDGILPETQGYISNILALQQRFAT